MYLRRDAEAAREVPLCAAAPERMPHISHRFVARPGCVLVGFDLADPGPELGVAQQGVHERDGAADARPVVIPQRRDQPAPVDREHQVRQDPDQNEPGARRRQLAACSGPARTSTYCQFE